MILKTFTLAVCLSTAVAAQAAVPETAPDNARTMRFVPLGGFHVGTGEARPVPLPPFITEYDADETPGGLLEFAREAIEPVEADQLVGVLQARYGDAMDEDRLYVDLGERGLRLWGEAELVEAAAAYVDALEAVLVPRIRVDAWLVPVEDARIGSDALPVFGPADALDTKTATWHASATVADGQPVDLGDWRRTAVVREINTEVAQNSSVSNPVVGSLNEGVRVAVEVHALAGSADLVVFGQCAVADRRSPIRAEPTGVPGQPSIDVVDVDDLVTSFSARIPAGGGLVVWSGGSGDFGGRNALVVRAQRLSSGAATVEGLTVLPVGALVRAGLDRRTRCRLDSPYAEPFALTDEEWPAPIDFDVVFDSIQAALGEAIDEERVWISELGGLRVVLQGDANERAIASEVVRRLEQQMLVNVGVVLRTTAADGRLLHEVAFPALLGRPHAMFRGVETTGVRSQSSEIAQDAAILRPTVESRFGGLAVSFLPMLGTRGVQVDAEVDLMVLDPATRRALEGEHGGILSTVTKRHARFLYEGPLQRSNVVTLGDGPRVGGMRTTQTLEIR